MNNGFTIKQRLIMRLMLWLSGVATVVTLVLRVWLMPSLRDNDTGRFATSDVVMVLMVLALLALGLLAFALRQPPPTVGRRGAMPLSVATLLAGVVLLVATLWDVWMLVTRGQVPPPQAAATGAVGTVTLWLMLLSGLVGGVALVYWGLQVSAEGTTRQGAGSFLMLAPTFWMWFRLARYEMSYASAIGLSETFYDLLLFIFMLLFLYKMARFVTGVGTPCMGSLLFCSLGAAMLGLSGPLTRLCMYLSGDYEAYTASQLAGWPDFALGLLGAVFAFVLVILTHGDSFSDTVSPSSPSQQ